MKPIQHNHHLIDFDARVTAWEKNEAREAKIMSSSLVAHFSTTIESTPHNSHALYNHRSLQVWNPTPSPHTHRTFILYLLTLLTLLTQLPS